MNSNFGRNSLFRENIITSILDRDFYEMNMGQCVYHQFPYVEEVEFALNVRSKVDLRPYRVEIMEEIEKIDMLGYTEDQIMWLSKIKWLTKDYLEHLRMFRLQSRFISVGEKDGQLSLRIKGPFTNTTDFDNIILAIISEVYNRNVYPNAKYEDVRKPLFEKIAYIKEMHKQHDLTGFAFSDFGTRRRFSYEAQYVMVDTFRKELPEFFVGTSNMALAKEMGLTPIGTMAHKIFMLAQQMDVQLRNFQKFTLEAWVKEFRGLLGHALTDTIGMDAFIKDFDLYFAKLFDGLRHDSGDEFIFGEKAIAMYNNLRIDPMSKTLTYSNRLDFPKAIAIFLHFRNQINTRFGIGTHLSNDVVGTKPIDMVIKLVSVNGRPVAKISDDPGKNMCEDAQYVQTLRTTFNVQ